MGVLRAEQRRGGRSPWALHLEHLLPLRSSLAIRTRPRFPPVALASGRQRGRSVAWPLSHLGMLLRRFASARASWTAGREVGEREGASPAARCPSAGGSAGVASCACACERHRLPPAGLWALQGGSGLCTAHLRAGKQSEEREQPDAGGCRGTALELQQRKRAASARQLRPALRRWQGAPRRRRPRRQRGRGRGTN